MKKPETIEINVNERDNIDLNYGYPISFISIDINNATKNSLILFIIFIGLIIPLFHFFSKDTSSEKMSKEEKQEVKEWSRHMSVGFQILFLSFISTGAFNLYRRSSHFDVTFNVLFAWEKILVTFLILLAFLFVAQKYAQLLWNTIILLIFLFPLLGYTFASLKSSYYVAEHEKQRYAVLTTYKEKFLIAPVNFETKTITPEYSLIEAKTQLGSKPSKKEKDSEEQLIFTHIITGKLTLEKPKTAEKLLEEGKEKEKEQKKEAEKRKKLIEDKITACLKEQVTLLSANQIAELIGEKSTEVLRVLNELSKTNKAELVVTLKETDPTVE
ncbi:hypothetical protein ACFOU2_21900 [Bacillus songklensis]|uniref:Uncharacterized protein n=1 Tax=Bacillus songklensis TaxID=1069116 RepID=A0ABV8B921_9BACI